MTTTELQVFNTYNDRSPLTDNYQIVKASHWDSSQVYSVLHGISEQEHERTFCIVIASGPGAKSPDEQVTEALAKEKSHVRTQSIIAQAHYYAMHGGDY